MVHVLCFVSWYTNARNYAKIMVRCKERERVFMKRVFSWPTRIWNQEEILNLLYLFCPQSKLYHGAVFETMDTLNMNAMVQPELYHAIHSMRIENARASYCELDYMVLRGNMQMRLSEPCSGLGQLLVNSRSRVKYTLPDGRDVIGMRPYGDVRILDEIISLAIHLCLISYNEITDRFALTDLGKNAVSLQEKTNEIPDRNHIFKTDDWWSETLLLNPVLHRFLSIVNESETPLMDLKIWEQMGYYGDLNYDPVPVSGYLYSYLEPSVNGKQRESDFFRFLDAAAAALVKAGLITKTEYREQENEKGVNSFSYQSVLYQCTKAGKELLQMTEDRLRLSLRLFYADRRNDGAAERRMLLMSLLANKENKKCKGLLIKDFLLFFQSKKPISRESFLVDLLGFVRMGFPIECRNLSGTVSKVTEKELLEFNEDESVFFFSSIQLIDDDICYPEPNEVTDLNSESKMFLKQLHGKNRYMTLIDYWKNVIYYSENQIITDQILFNQLLSDLICHTTRMNAYTIFSEPCLYHSDFLIAPMIYCYDTRESDLWVIDTSFAFKRRIQKGNVTGIRKKNVDIPKTANDLITHFMENRQMFVEKEKTDDLEDVVIEQNGSLRKRIEDVIYFLYDQKCIQSENPVQTIHYKALYRNSESDVKDIYERILDQEKISYPVKLSFEKWDLFIERCCRSEDLNDAD